MVETGFKIGDWVIGWHNNTNHLNKNTWQIDKIDEDGYVYPVGKPNWNTNYLNVKLVNKIETIEIW